jgi:hypothetical protein
VRCFSFRHLQWPLTLDESRLLTLVAEDNAIEDTIYHLHRALNAGRIDLERFLRVITTSLASCVKKYINAHLEHALSGRRTIHETGLNREDPCGDAYGLDWIWMVLIENKGLSRIGMRKFLSLLADFISLYVGFSESALQQAVASTSKTGASKINLRSDSGYQIRSPKQYTC